MGLAPRWCTNNRRLEMKPETTLAMPPNCPRNGSISPYLILATGFPLEALAASFPVQLMVEMPQTSAFTFGGLVHPEDSHFNSIDQYLRT